MSNREPRPPSDYPVGYGRPPKATQFKPGQSGNPKGRPKGHPSDAAILNKVLEEKVTVTENGKARRISKREVIMRRLTSDAMRGDRHAIKQVFPVIGPAPEASHANNGDLRGTNTDARTVIVVPSDGRDPIGPK